MNGHFNLTDISGVKACVRCYLEHHELQVEEDEAHHRQAEGQARDHL